MRDYHLLSAVAGDLLCRAGAHEQAREHFLRAAALTAQQRGAHDDAEPRRPVRGPPRDIALTRQLAFQLPATVARADAAIGAGCRP